MLDLLYLGITAGFFAVAAVYVFGLKRLQSEADDE